MLESSSGLQSRLGRDTTVTTDAIFYRATLAFFNAIALGGWLARKSQTQKLLNVLPFLKPFHCSGCGVPCVKEYCDRCQPMVNDISRPKKLKHYWIHHNGRYVKPQTCVSVDKSLDEMYRLVYYLMAIYDNRRDALASYPPWLDDEGILAEELAELLVKHYGAILTSKSDIDQWEEIEIDELHAFPGRKFPYKVDSVGQRCYGSIDHFAKLTKEFWVDGLGDTVFALACKKSVPKLEDIGGYDSSIRDWSYKDDEPF